MYVRDTFEVGYDDSVDVTIVDENGGEVYMADFSAYGYTEPQESDIVYINDEMFKILLQRSNSIKTVAVQVHNITG